MQGPPGTGKTSAMIAIISALLAKHYTPPPQVIDPHIAASDQGNAGATLHSEKTLLASNALDARPGSAEDNKGAKASRRRPKFKHGEEEQAAGKAGVVAAEKDKVVVLPKFRVLVCAQSNAAIDEVIGRLASPGLLTGEVSSMAWHSVAWHGTACLGLTWYSMAWYGIARHGMA